MSPLDQLFKDETQDVRDALALHKAEKRRADRANFAARNGLQPEIQT